MHALSLLAEGNRPGSPFATPELIYGTIGLASALLVGAGVLYAVDRWRKRAVLKANSPGTELTDFRAMYERGEITEAEYARLRKKVAARVNPSKPVEPPADAAPPGPVPPGPFPPGYFDDPPGAGAGGRPA